MADTAGIRAPRRTHRCTWASGTRQQGGSRSSGVMGGHQGSSRASDPPGRQPKFGRGGARARNSGRWSASVARRDGGRRPASGAVEATRARWSSQRNGSRSSGPWSASAARWRPPGRQPKLGPVEPTRWRPPGRQPSPGRGGADTVEATRAAAEPRARWSASAARWRRTRARQPKLGPRQPWPTTPYHGQLCPTCPHLSATCPTWTARPKRFDRACDGAGKYGA